MKKLEDYKSGEYVKMNDYKALYQVKLITTGDGMTQSWTSY